jgi:hypothetical protein
MVFTTDKNGKIVKGTKENFAFPSVAQAESWVSTNKWYIIGSVSAVVLIAFIVFMVYRRKNVMGRYSPSRENFGFRF